MTRCRSIGVLRGLALAATIVAVSGAAHAAEDQLVVYSANESTLDNLVFEAFKKETGIQVQPVEAGSGVLVKRIAAEKDRPQGDILWGVSRSLMQTNADYFAPYRSKNVDAVPPEFRDPQDRWLGTNVHLLVILANTKQVAAADMPKSWGDLLDPKWKGKIAFTDPANSGSAYTNTTMLVGLWGSGDKGWAEVTKLYANMKVLNKSSLVFSGVGEGEYALGISLEYAGYIWASNGAPVKVIYPSDGTVTQMEGVAVIKGGPNLEPAKKFVDFVSRKDTREMILAHTFRRPARGDLDLEHLPGGLPSLGKVTVIKYDEQKWTDARPDAMQKIQDIVQKTR
ncbi:MAG TPA: ABC transporter substrate-binding protein [Stellaceae bacterium]|nr:ABC transporter substrate-binding protein [Stellaceae bacterium]